MKPSSHPASVRVLLIEDDVIDQRAFLRAVHGAGLPYDCTVTASLQEARDCLRQTSPDLVIADYHLRDGTALDILLDVVDVPVIIVTGVGDEAIAVQAMKSGAYDYVVKDSGRHYLNKLPLVIDSVLRRRQLELEEREQRTLANMLRDTAAVLNSTLNLDEVLKRILENVAHIIPHDTSSVMLLEGDVAQVAMCNGWPIEHLRSHMTPALRIDQAEHLGLMYHTRHFCIIPDVESYSGWVQFPQVHNPRSYLAAPIRVGDEVIGFLNLDSMTRDAFTPLHAEHLRAFVDQAAVALHNARLFQKARELAVLEERQRLARDLHDSVTQTLFAASMMTKAITRQWKRDPTRIGDELHELQDLTQGALAEMRTLLLELRPSALLEVKLCTLLRQLAETLKGRSRLHVHFACEEHIVLPPEVHVACFRIAQEALNNTVKHARASQVWITFAQESQEVTLTIRDDGRGFDLASVQATHMGIGIMQERAAEAGITLTVASQLGAGTTVHARWHMERVGSAV